MCLAIVAWDAHPAYALVVAANRDEFHARPAVPAAWWPEDLLAGRDLAAGGTWLGVTRDGRFAFLTNVRDPARHDPSAPSRGCLVPQVLSDRSVPEVAVARARDGARRHNGFNLIAGGCGGGAWASNRADRIRVLGRGVHGVSNGVVDEDWPKVRRTKAALAAWAASGDTGIEPLFAALADRSIAPDRELPSTGVPLDLERRLSAVFIAGERYGTRCSTVVAIAHEGTAHFVERTFAPDGSVTGEVTEHFATAGQRSARSITT